MTEEECLTLMEIWYNELKGISTKPLPKGWEQERYDMYIRNGYTITEDGRLFKDGREIK